MEYICRNYTLKQQHKIILEQDEILNIIRNVTNKKDITLVTAIGSTDADMRPTFELTFTINSEAPLIEGQPAAQ